MHHGNGTEAIFIDDPDTLTISLHQEHNYPTDTGDADVTGDGAGVGANINIPLPPGAGHATYLEAMDRLVIPALKRFQPDVIIVACGYDAAAIDPLGRMLATADTFRAADPPDQGKPRGDLCGGKLVLVHEGGYSEVYVPFCGHAVLRGIVGQRHHRPRPIGRYPRRAPAERPAAGRLQRSSRRPCRAFRAGLT